MDDGTWKQANERVCEGERERENPLKLSLEADEERISVGTRRMPPDRRTNNGASTRKVLASLQLLVYPSIYSMNKMCVVGNCSFVLENFKSRFGFSWIYRFSNYSGGLINEVRG